MRKIIYLVVSIIGIAIMGLGVSGRPNRELGFMVMLGGFIITLSGFIGLYQQVLKMPTKGEGESSERAPMIRIALGVVVLATLALPYIRLPLELEAENESYSFLQLVQLMIEGQQIDDGLILLAFVAIIIAGGFLSFFHHIGGYIIILGTGAMTYIIMISIETDAITVILNEYEYGLYIALIGALFIIFTGFLKSNIEMGSRSDW